MISTRSVTVTSLQCRRWWYPKFPEISIKLLKELFVDDALDQTQTYNWFKRSRRPSTHITPEHVVSAWNPIVNGRRQTTKDIFNIVGLSEQLNMRRIATIYVLWFSKGEQEQSRMDVCGAPNRSRWRKFNMISKQDGNHTGKVHLQRKCVKTTATLSPHWSVFQHSCRVKVWAGNVQRKERLGSPPW